MFLGVPWAAVASVGLGLGLLFPALVMWLGIKQASSSALNALPYVMRFTEDAFEQLSQGERRALIKYSEIAMVEEIPEGMRISIVKDGRWVLMQRTAFKNPSDFDAACDLLIRAGKMRPR
jgi:hypothetical protein